MTYLIMTYIGIEFVNDNDEDDAVMAIVHRSWLSEHKDQVWWPFYKTSSRINKALIKAEIPDKKKWELCAVDRLIFEYGMLYFSLKVSLKDLKKFI